MKMRLMSLLLLGAILLASPSASQNISDRASKVSGEDFVRAFVGNCGLNAGNIDLVIASAKALNFAPLPEQFKPLMAPQDPNAEFSGFLVLDGDGSPYLLGVSRSVSDGKTMEACAVANPYIKTSTVVSALSKIVGLGTADEDESQMGQRYRLWATAKWMAGSYVMLTDAEPMGLDGATLGIVAPSIK